MSRGSAATKVAAAIATAPDASPAARWQTLFGCPPPQRLARLVEQAVAWREQVLVHGDVSTAVAHDLRLAAEHALQQRRPATSLKQPSPAAGEELVVTLDAAPPLVTGPAARSRARSAALPPATSQLLPGSQLVKAHGGRNHVVRVEENGFRYEDALFASLSAVAKHITGTHWNGLLFFGLRKRRCYPPKPRRHG